MKQLKVLIGCENSGAVRRAFLERGHDAWSCDLLPAQDRSNRLMQCDVRQVLDMGWDLLAVMHPPCTRLCNSGVRWLHQPPKGRSQAEMWADLDEGAALFSACWNAPIARVAVENPVMHKHAKQRIENFQPAAQHVQPWWFGEPAFKATGLYLRGLPKLTPTNKLTPPEKGTEDHKHWSAIHRAPPGKLRWQIRSKTFPGIASAMADQWGDHAMAHKLAPPACHTVKPYTGDPMGRIFPIAVSETTAAKMMDMAPTEFRRLVQSGSLPLPVKITGNLEHWRVSDLEGVLTGDAMNEDEFSW